MRSLPRQAIGILSYFTRHRTAANLLLVLMLAAGLTAFPQMRAQFFPDVISDEIDIEVRWDGAGAEDVDAAIVAVLEPVLVAVPGVAATSATSREGRASIEIEFDPAGTCRAPPMRCRWPSTASPTFPRTPRPRPSGAARGGTG
jgi:multidrug efflux pump subunit AcrB